MKRYWFHSTMPKDTISEGSLTDEQKKIIEIENKKINSENKYDYWIGYKNDDGWDFMRNGLEVIHIDESRGNVARNMLANIIDKKYKD